MTLDRADFARIRVAIAAAVLMIAAGATLAWFADRRHAASISAEAAVRRQLNEFEGRLKQVRSEETEIKQKAALFSNLRTKAAIRRVSNPGIVSPQSDAGRAWQGQYLRP